MAHDIEIDGYTFRLEMAGMADSTHPTGTLGICAVINGTSAAPTTEQVWKAFGGFQSHLLALGLDIVEHTPSTQSALNEAWRSARAVHTSLKDGEDDVLLITVGTTRVANVQKIDRTLLSTQEPHRIFNLV